MENQSLPSQTFVKIKEVKNGVVFLKGGGFRKILIVSGINFDLKSEEEQNQIIGSFQSFLNTLDFPVQFFIHSRKVNISAYLTRMEQRKHDEQNSLLKIQIEEYIQFVKTFVDQNAIINKSFFVVVTFDPVSMQQKTQGISSFLGLSTSKKYLKDSANATLEESLGQLDQRVESISNGLSSIGLRATPLGDEEIIELFYNLYNPQLVEKKGVEVGNTKSK